MYQPIHEKISVTAVFLPGKNPRLISFVWQDKEYLVEKLTLVTRAKHGREAIWMFHITTKTAAFKIRLDTESLTWWVEEYTWDSRTDNS
jgi:hypothetical protein